MENNLTYYLELINTYFAGEASGAQMSEIAGWIRAEEDHRKIFDEQKKLWDKVNAVVVHENTDTEKEYQLILKKIHPESSSENTSVYQLNRSYTTTTKRSIPLWLKIAAVVLVILIPAAVTYKVLIDKKETPVILYAGENKISENLPDGSVVTLNAGSELSFNKNFDGSSRDVTLKGEAHFKVQHDENKPFIVACGNIRVEVLGTEFYVNSMPGSDSMEVFLLNGSVAVYYSDMPEIRKILKPGETAGIAKTTHNIIIAQNPDINLISWQTGKLVFDDMPLSQVAAHLEKMYKCRIIFKDSQLTKCKITATFENQPLDAVLNVLKATLNIDYTKQGKEIHISGKGCN